MTSAAVLERQARAAELVQAGQSYDDIAAELGYANRSGAWKAVQRALSSHLAESVDEPRMLEVLRLDAMQEALWDKATAGDVRAGLAVLRIIVQRVRLLGLVPDSEIPSGKPSSATSLVAQSFWDHVREVHGGDYRAYDR